MTLRRAVSEFGGACGDLGTLLPHVIGAIAIAGMAPVGVLFGFGAALIGSGLFYGLPMAAQPMKAVSAVMITGQLGPAEVVATGLLMGVSMLVLGLTGSIGWLARSIPQSITAGLQAGLGLSMAVLGMQLILTTPVMGLLALALLLGLTWLDRVPAVPAVLLLAVVGGLLSGMVGWPESLRFGAGLPSFSVPSWPEILTGLEIGVVSQLPLTLTNAVIVTALVCRDLFPENSRRATERNLATRTGIGNMLLAPFGAMPMCHGAGGVKAQYRFGARGGLAPIMLGIVLLGLAFGLAESAAALFALIPAGALGALVFMAGCDLALSRRLFDARPACWPAIGVAAGLTLAVNPAVGLAAGWALELARLFAKSRGGKQATP